MFINTFTKTLYTKRFMMLAWVIGIVALVVFTMIFFPTLSKSFGESLKNVPDSLKSFVGDSNTYSTIAGYTDLQIFIQLESMLLIFGIILFTGLLAGDETDGTLQTLLAQPINRGRVYVEKLLSGMVLLACASASILVGVVVGLLLIHEHLGIVRLLESTLATWLITLVFCAIGYTLGAATGKRGLSGGLAGVIAFTSFIISSLADSVKGLRIVDRFSPFHYFDKPGILVSGPRWSDMLILALVSIVTLTIGYFMFTRRDIYQR